MSNMDTTRKFEIKIDPLELYTGLKDQMAEFESLIRMNPGKKLAENVEKKLKSRFCHCCFFGHVTGEIMGEPLCDECMRELYGITETKDKYNPLRLGKRAFDLQYQLWYRRHKALPIFEAYLHAEIERYKLEQQTKDKK